jgi:hypothetical protein
MEPVEPNHLLADDPDRAEASSPSTPTPRTHRRFLVSHGDGRVFYTPDVVSIPEPSRALTGAEICIGDGASILRPLIVVTATAASAMPRLTLKSNGARKQESAI